MAKNRVLESGRRLTLPVLAGTVSGAPVIVGMLPGVALTDRDSSGNAAVEAGEGVFSVSVTGAIASVGLPVYITSATGALVVAPGVGIQLLRACSADEGRGCWRDQRAHRSVRGLVEYAGVIAEERETVVNATDADDVLRIWTAQRRFITHLRRHPKVTETRTGRVDGTEWAEFTIPADAWSPVTGVRRASGHSFEQNRAAAERLAAVRAAKTTKDAG